VRQIGHLPELYEDARSEKCKIQRILSTVCGRVHKFFKNLESTSNF